MKKIRRFFRAGGMFFAGSLCALLLCGCGKPAQKTAAVSKMHLEIGSEPEGAQIFVNGSPAGKTPKKFSVRPGNYLLRFAKEGYEPQFVPLEITGSGSKRLDVRLQEAAGSALLVSSPGKALVVVNGKIMGETPYVLAPLKPGKHSVQIRKSDYAVRTVEFETKDARPVKVSVNLQSNIGKLVIRSKPANARVFINGKSVGTTPYQGNWPEGATEYKLQLGGYGEITGKKTVLRGKTTYADHTLQILPAALKVDSNPAGAAVWIGKTNYGKTPLVIRDLTPGREYTVILRMPGCGEEIRKIAIPPGGTGNITARLSSDKGGIDLLSGPAGLTVYCDGRKVGVLKPAAPGETAAAVLEIRDLLPGRHKISIAHSRGIPSRIDKEVVVVKKKIVRVDAGTIWVPNAVIYYRDGQTSLGYIHGESKEKGYWFEDARYHSPDGGSVKGYVPYDKVRKVERLPFGE